MANWFLSPALAQLRKQIDEMYPDRKRVSDGTIGDAAHAARKSDHNPDWDSNGIVRALDLTAEGLPVSELIRHIIADKRTRYVISNGLIWQVVDPHWRKYTGANKHDRHFHISIRDVAGHDMDASPWDLGKEADMALSDEDIKRIAKAVWNYGILPTSNLERELGSDPVPASRHIRAIEFRVENEYRSRHPEPKPTGKGKA